MSNKNLNDRSNGQLKRAFYAPALQYVLRPIIGDPKSGLFKQAYLLGLALTVPSQQKISLPSLKEIRQIFKATRHIRKVFNLADALMQVDDVLDVIDPDKILSMGEAHYGVSPCDFLSIEEIGETEYLRKAQDVVEVGVVPSDVQNGFGNLHAVLVKEQAAMQVAFLDDYSNATRKGLEQTDMALA